MEWNQIVGFYYVARFGGFTKAAESTFKTQSALTHQVKALEAELDCLLFERIGKRKIHLTPAGEKLFLFAESLIEKYNYLMDDLNELKGQKKGQLRLAAPFTTLYHLLPERIRTYSQLYPWVELTLLDRSQQNVLLLLKEGDIDFGLVLESMVPKELNCLRWKETETVIMAPKGHPLTRQAQVQLEQISQYPLILPPRSALGRIKLDELFGKLGIKYRIIMESSNVELSSIYTEMGMGISFATLVKEHPNIKNRNLQFISLNHYFEADYVVVAMRKTKFSPSFKTNFINVLFDKMKLENPLL